jgi:gamma-glutamyltranspeptidase / glutathione hydrolase
MKGAIAAGHPLTAEAGARILAEGGNAVDACIAAACVSWVAESPLTGPGGGGFLLVHRAMARRGRPDTVLDFFVAVPGKGLSGENRAPMEEVAVSFDGTTSQTFLVGAASCAVPGAVAGLAEAHRLYARLPWLVLLQPAIELARRGVPLNEAQGFLHGVLDPILRHGEAARAIYGEACGLGPGETLHLGELAVTLEQLAEEGEATFYRGELASRLAATVQEQGGSLTPEDLAAYRVIRRGPVRVAYRAGEFVSNPPPAAGGLLVGFALRVLDRLGDAKRAGSAGEIATLAEVMRQATGVRGTGFISGLNRGGIAGRVLADERVHRAADAVREGLRGNVTEPVGLPSTTHISVVDGDGNAASLSASTGCGSGVVVPGTGIHVNNMLGEVDLNPGGTAGSPGRRLTSMMAPSILLEDGRARLVLGSAGSARLRGAIVQIIRNVVDHELPLEEALPAPRVHFEDGLLHLEGGIDLEVADELEADGYDVVRWNARNLYFGGAAAVAYRADAGLEAAGDPRRGGAGVVVR